MSRCPGCEAADVTERAAIECRDDPDPSIAECTCTDREVDVLFISPARFRQSPQVGVPCTMTWGSLATYLSRPSVGETKDEAGGISVALYRDGIRRRANLVHVWALVLDVDEGGEVERVAAALANYSAIIHSTFSSTNDAPRCRAYIELAEAIDAETYDPLHAIVRRVLLQQHEIVVDNGAKDASRLSFAPVIREGAVYHFRRIDGRRLDAAAVLRTNAPPTRAPKPASEPNTNTDAYVRGALGKAYVAVATAGEGARNDTLNREAYSLSRLDLPDYLIERTLMDAASAAGLSRHEATRTIASALRARRGAS